METITNLVSDLNSLVWGWPMLIAILGTRLFLTSCLRLLTVRKIPFGFSLLWKGRIPGDAAGEISPFNALMT
ncbi:MAG: sodium:alanine symporter family protein, partial [Alphaproteobacteria bacterium]